MCFSHGFDVLMPSQVSGFSPTRMDLEMLRRFEGEDLQRCGWGDNKFNGGILGHLRIWAENWKMGSVKGYTVLNRYV